MRKTVNDFILDGNMIHENKYDYSLITEYINSNIKVPIICPQHGIFHQSRKVHINLKCGCPECKQDRHRERSREKIRQFSREFKQKAMKVHGDKYQYDNIVYKRTNMKVSITCPSHGNFLQRPNDHLTGYGCPSCGQERTSSSQFLTTEDFIKKAKKKHNDKFDYSLVKYTGTHKHINIICPQHGIFTQTPRQHLRGKSGGCLKCAGLFKDTADFIQHANKTHHNLYDYSNTKYVNATTKVIICCKEHGNFIQRPLIHLNGGGCPQCALTQYSKKSIRWLQFIEKKDNVNIIHFENFGEYKIPGTRYKVDGYCKETNTVYEFQGDVFHGNPLKFKKGDKCHPFNKNITAGQLLKRTQQKLDIIKEKGYNVIIIWESDWDIIENGYKQS